MELPTLGDDGTTVLWDWLRFTAAANEEDLAMTDLDNPATVRAVTVVKHVDADEQARDEQWLLRKTEFEQASRQCYARVGGLAEGREEGRAEEREAVARNALQPGLDIEQVAAITGLTADEPARLAEP